MIKQIYIAALVSAAGALALAATAQDTGQQQDMAQNASAGILEHFADPPNAYRPLIITHMGPLADRGVLDWLAEREVGGAVIDGGVVPGSEDVGDEPWNNPTYLNDPSIFENLREVMNTLHEQGREIWLYDELGYPSASAGGRVLEGHPEYAVVAVRCRTFRGAGGAPIEVDVEHDVVACYALPAEGDTLDLERAEDLTARAKDGGFSWTPSEGEWAVTLFERFQPDTWKRHNIARRNVNILDKDAIARFIDLTHEKYAEELGDQLDQAYMFFTDEPQFGATEPWIHGLPEAQPAVQWTDELPGAFQNKAGYDLIPVLPALFHDVGNKTSKYRYDFYDVQSDLAAENFFGQIEEWCHEHDIASSGHMLLEESLLFHVMFSGSMFKNWARCDLPGVDLLSIPRYKTMGGWNGDIIDVPEDFSCKAAASVAHLLEKDGVFTETYAVAKGITLREALGIAAWQFATGVTHMCTYTLQNEITAEEYAAFSAYAGRLALAARHGKPVADVAVLAPEGSVWAAYNPPSGGLFPTYLKQNPEALHIDDVFRQACHFLLKNQRDFECFTEELLDEAEIGDGAISMAGMRFPVLVLPEVRMVHEETLARVRKLLDGGGYAVFVGSLPSQFTDTGETDAATEQAKALLADFPERALHVEQAEDLQQAVDWIQQQAPPVLKWDGPDSIRILHRTDDKQDVLLVANPSAEDASGKLRIPAAGRVAVLDAETGASDTSSGAATLAQGDWVEISVPADSARVVVIAKAGA